MHRFLGLPVGHSWAPGEGPTLAEQFAMLLHWLMTSGFGLALLLVAGVLAVITALRIGRRARRRRRRAVRPEAEAPVSMTRLRLSRMPLAADDEEDEGDEEEDDQDGRRRGDGRRRSRRA